MAAGKFPISGRKEQEVCCFQIFADNLCRVVCDESEERRKQTGNKERKKVSGIKKERKKERKKEIKKERKKMRKNEKEMRKK